jgi:hypothetical protein
VNTRVGGVTAAASSISTAFLSLVPVESAPGGVATGAVFCLDTAPPVGGFSACQTRTPEP